MNILSTSYRVFWVGLILCAAIPASATAGLIVNGGFESGFASWTRMNQTGSEGNFLLQSGSVSPVNAFGVPVPPQGTTAAMTDAQGPGSHVLYQDFTVPTFVPAAFVNFSLFINNGATAFSTPSTLDFSTPALNQQARVDIVTTAANPFSVAVSDVLQTLYQTQTGSPLVSGYNSLLVDVTALLQSRQGQTLRLRFAEVDNVNYFNFGVDAVDINVGEIPEPSTWILSLCGLGGLGVVRLRSRSH